MSETVLSVQNLCKKYPGFELKDVSFALPAGTITGFIGRNGAGKTTTLKALLNLVHPDAGKICFFGEEFADSELAIKRRIGFVSGGVSYYPAKRLSQITAVNRSFYPDWDDAAYRGYLSEFGLDESKRPKELSEGMKVKYALTLALSHHAQLLILDEPTSGLDPVSRDDLLDVFLSLTRRSDVTILFSTHITSDLEKCADNIVYIRGGRVVEDCGREALMARYRSVQLAQEPDGELKSLLIGAKPERTGWSALIAADRVPAGLATKPADLETIMIHMEKEEG